MVLICWLCPQIAAAPSAPERWRESKREAAFAVGAELPPPRVGARNGQPRAPPSGNLQASSIIIGTLYPNRAKFHRPWKSLVGFLPMQRPSQKPKTNRQSRGARHCIFAPFSRRAPPHAPRPRGARAAQPAAIRLRAAAHGAPAFGGKTRPAESKNRPAQTAPRPTLARLGQPPHPSSRTESRSAFGAHFRARGRLTLGPLHPQPLSSPKNLKTTTMRECVCLHIGQAGLQTLQRAGGSSASSTASSPAMPDAPLAQDHRRRRRRLQHLLLGDGRRQARPARGLRRPRAVGLRRDPHGHVPPALPPRADHPSKTARRTRPTTTPAATADLQGDRRPACSTASASSRTTARASRASSASTPRAAAR